MLRRRSRTIPDDDSTPDRHEEARASTRDRPSIEHHTPPSGIELDLDLTDIDARRPAPLTAAPAPAPAEGWERLDDEEDADDDDDELEEHWDEAEEQAAPAAPVARRTPLRAAPPPVRPPVPAAPPSRQDAISSDIQSIVSDTVTRVLSNAMVELELEPGTLQELRDQGALHQLTAAVARIEQQTALVDGLARQVAALTTAVDELTDSTRALLRHQWDNMPPPNFYVRVQRADDEVRRALDQLGTEVRSRMPRAPRSTR
jgi:hypothetical protein